MKSMHKYAVVFLGILFLSGCGSDGTPSSSSGGGASGADASKCVTRSLKAVYVNECDYAVNVIIFEAGATPFRINADSAKSQSSSGNSFGACRAPSMPVLNSDSSGFTCS